MSAMAVIIATVGGVAVASAFLVAVGIWASRLLRKSAPDSVLVSRVTPTGSLLFGCFTAALMCGAAFRTLAPESGIGSLLATCFGVLLGLVLLWLTFTMAALALQALGYPIYYKQGRDV